MMPWADVPAPIFYMLALPALGLAAALAGAVAERVARWRMERRIRSLSAHEPDRPETHGQRWKREAPERQRTGLQRHLADYTPERGHGFLPPHDRIEAEFQERHGFADMPWPSRDERRLRELRHWPVRIPWWRRALDFLTRRSGRRFTQSEIDQMHEDIANDPEIDRRAREANERLRELRGRMR